MHKLVNSNLLLGTIKLATRQFNINLSSHLLDSRTDSSKPRGYYLTLYVIRDIIFKAWKKGLLNYANKGKVKITYNRSKNGSRQESLIVKIDILDDKSDIHIITALFSHIDNKHKVGTTVEHNITLADYMPPFVTEEEAIANYIKLMKR